MDLDAVLAVTFSLVGPGLTERQRRLLLGAVGRGGLLDTVRWEANQLTESIGAPVILMLWVSDSQLPRRSYAWPVSRCSLWAG